MCCTRLFVAIFAGSICLQIVTAQTGSGDARRQFRGGTSLVSLDVRVLDRDGRPIQDLTEGDFEVTDDGMVVPITVFERRAFSNGPVRHAAPSVLRRDLEVSNPSAADRRVFLLILGRADMGRCVLNLSPDCSFTSGIRNGLAGLSEFVGSLGANDYVAVLAYNRLTDFTTDHATTRELLARYEEVNQRIETDLVFVETGLAGIFGSREPPPQTQALIDGIFGGVSPLSIRRLAPASGAGIQRLRAQQQDLFRAMEEASLPSSGPSASNTVQLLTSAMPSSTDAPGKPVGGATSTGMVDDGIVSFTIRGLKDIGYAYTGIDALRPLTGEKHLVFLSPGGLADDSNATAHLAEVASDARIAIHVIHTGGVSASSPGLAAGSRLLARTTGGTFEANRFNQAAQDLRRMLESTSFQYLLGYERPLASGPRRFRDVRVTVKRPGAALHYRRGYVSPADNSDETLRRTLKYTRVAAAAEYAKEIDDLPFEAAGLQRSDPRRAELTLRLDLSGIPFERAPTGRGTATLEVAVFCLSTRGQPVGEVWRTVELDLTDARRTQLEQQGGVPVRLEVPLTGNADSAKVVVYDYGADLLGSRNVKVERK
jgi:VWFA-related protein